MGPGVEDADRDLGRLRWRCRRGMRELDILLSRYVSERFRAATAAEQAAFRRLLDAPDCDLQAFLLGLRPAPPDFAALIESIAAVCAGSACRRHL